MGFYSRYIFPHILDKVMSSGQMSKVRAAVLAEVSGDVFEVGFGTGLNLPHYPAHVKQLITADPNPGMSTLAQRRIDASGIKVTHHTVSGEDLPLDSASFDCVVCTWTLCSIPDAARALREFHRILRPNGKLHFVEHGVAADENVRRWQVRLTPLNKVFADGCHLDRDMRTLIHSQRFRIDSLTNFYLPKTPRVGGYLYQGVAVKA